MQVLYTGVINETNDVQLAQVVFYEMLRLFKRRGARAEAREFFKRLHNYDIMINWPGVLARVESLN
jgi:hypothetical protein